jgi:hypothetical protein
MESCPKCQSMRVHVSRTRSRFERIRRSITGKSPFRCSECGWRGWAFDFSSAQSRTEGVDVATAEPNLAALDAAIERNAASDDVDLDRALSPAARPRPSLWQGAPSASLPEWPPQSPGTAAAATGKRAAAQPADTPGADGDRVLAALTGQSRPAAKKRITKKAPLAAPSAPGGAAPADARTAQQPAAPSGADEAAVKSQKARRSRTNHAGD